MKNSRAGFSLVEVMVSIGVLSGLGLFLMRQQDQASQIKNKLTVDQEVDSVIQQVGRILRDPDACTKTLEGKTLNSSTAITLKNNEILFRPDSSMYIFGRGQVTTKSEVITGTHKLRFKEIKFDELRENKTGPLISEVIKVVFEYESGKQVKTKTHYFYVQTQKNGTQVQRCLTENDMLKTAAMRKACEGLGAAYVDTPYPGKCTFEDQLPQCFLTGDNSCPVGYSVQRSVETVAVEVEGRRICKQEYQKINGAICVDIVDPYAGGYRADSPTWWWKGNCECLVGMTCPCKVGINFTCQFTKKATDCSQSAPEWKSLNLKNCCKS